MAETTKRDETTFDEKRKLDSCCEAREEYPSKIQKLEVLDSDSCNAVKNGEKGEVPNHNFDDIKDNSMVVKENDGETVADDVDAEKADDEDEYENDVEDEDDEDDGEEYDSEDGKNSSGNAVRDHKGKGVVKDDKGKGKLIEEEDDDDDDGSDDGSELDGEESDLSDDPLAEVDLDNILPSRTRRRTVQPGVYIAKDLGNDDDDSDDSDA